MPMVPGEILECSNTTFLFASNFEVDYGSEEHATIVYKTLVVDKEVKKLLFPLLNMCPCSLNSSCSLFVHGKFIEKRNLFRVLCVAVAAR
jgi:hypothetical protein